MAEVRDILRLEVNTRARETWGYQTNSRVLQLLERACPARSTGEPHEREVLLLDCVEAKHYIESSVPLTVPVVTQDQQMFEWEDGSRPIQQLCKRTGMLKRKVCVQVPSQSLKRTSESFKKVDISQVFDRLLENSGSNDPWNVLDFGSELPSLIIPVCLTGANAQLLLLIKNVIMSGKE
ncbi:hypothetical protein LTS18_012117, partial [Coniosporium uncinatum]